MRRAAQAAVAVAVLFVIAALVCFVTAIWVVGPDAGRLGGTAAVLLIAGTVLGFVGSCWLDYHEDES